MQITEIRSYSLRAQLQQPFAYSQWSFTHRESTLVKVRTDEGVIGWGEAYGPSPPIASAIDDFLGPMLVGCDPCDTERLWEFMFARSIDFGQKGIMLAAISAIDIALWDIKGHLAGMPLYRLLGGSPSESIPCYATGFYFGGEEPLEKKYQQEAETYLECGFGAMKMKVGRGAQDDAAMVAAVRDLVGGQVRLMIDANHAYDPPAAIDLARRIEPYEITWFEEPVTPLDPDSYLEVKRRTTIPLAGGECEYTRFGFEPWLRRRAFDYAQPDLCSCGGVSEAMKIAATASIYGIHVTPHVWGSAVGQAAAVHFYAARPRHPSTLSAEDKLIECDQTENPLRQQIVENPIWFDNGSWFLPQEPGLGLTVDTKALERFRYR